MEDVRAFIDPDEPDYAGATLALGSDALSHLAVLAENADPMVASKAVYLAGLIGGEQANSILLQAAGHGDPVVRVAVAASVENVEDFTALEVAHRLLGDADVGVRKVTLQSAAHLASPNVRAELQAVACDDDEDVIRALASDLDD